MSTRRGILPVGDQEAQRGLVANTLDIIIPRGIENRVAIGCEKRRSFPLLGYELRPSRYGGETYRPKAEGEFEKACCGSEKVGPAGGR